MGTVGKVVVAGGGVGGLTLALALRQAGVEIEVHERHDGLHGRATGPGGRRRWDPLHAADEAGGERKLHYSGFAAAGGISRFSHDKVPPRHHVELWARDAKAGLGEVGGGHVRWYMVYKAPAGAPGMSKAELLERAGGWYEPMRGAIEAADEDDIVTSEAWDLDQGLAQDGAPGHPPQPDPRLSAQRGLRAHPPGQARGGSPATPRRASSAAQAS